MSLRNQKIEDLWTRKDFIMLKKISIYKRILMLLVLCMHCFFTPGYPVSRGRNAVLYFWNVYVLCDQ